jgi:hypothetical protein
LCQLFKAQASPFLVVFRPQTRGQIHKDEDHFSPARDFFKRRHHRHLAENRRIVRDKTDSLNNSVWRLKFDESD